MAKRIISNILETQLGKYVNGMNGKSLQVGLWNGEIILNNLILKKEALDEFGLPIKFIEGTIKKIHVIVPWNQLGSASVKIHIEGIAILAIPNTDIPSRQQQIIFKRSRLEKAEINRRHQRLFLSKNNKSKLTSSNDENETTFFTRLITKIIDNIQITLDNIHIRYEDAVSIPLNPFSFGIILQSIQFKTTNAEGFDSFVDRTKDNNNNFFVHKLFQIHQLSIYWNRKQNIVNDFFSTKKAIKIEKLKKMNELKKSSKKNIPPVSNKDPMNNKYIEKLDNLDEKYHSLSNVSEDLLSYADFGIKLVEDDDLEQKLATMYALTAKQLMNNSPSSKPKLVGLKSNSTIFSSMKSIKNPVSKNSYVLRPATLSMQLTKNESPDYSTHPKYRFSTYINEVYVEIAKLQLKDAALLAEIFSKRLQLEAHFIKMKPILPIIDSPLDWWKYSCRYSIKRKNFRISFTWKSIKKSCLYRRGYINTWRKVATKIVERLYNSTSESKDTTEADTGNLHNTLSLEEINIVQCFEDTYPTDVIIFLRSHIEDLAIAEIEQKNIINQKIKEKNLKKKKSVLSSNEESTDNSTWYSYFFKGTEGNDHNVNETECGQLGQIQIDDNHDNLESNVDKLDPKSIFNDVLSEEGKKSLQNAYDYTKNIDDFFIPRDCKIYVAKVILRKVTLMLIEDEIKDVNKPNDGKIAEVNINGSAEYCYKQSKEWSAQLNIQNFHTINLKKKLSDPSLHTFCRMLPIEYNKDARYGCPSLQVIFSNHVLTAMNPLEVEKHLSNKITSFRNVDRKTFFKLTAVPLQIVLDIDFLYVLVDFFSFNNQGSFTNCPETPRPVNYFFYQAKSESSIFRGNAQLPSQSFAKKYDWDIVLDMDAPIIIIPEVMKQGNIDESKLDNNAAPYISKESMSTDSNTVFFDTIPTNEDFTDKVEKKRLVSIIDLGHFLLKSSNDTSSWSCQMRNIKATLDYNWCLDSSPKRDDIVGMTTNYHDRVTIVEDFRINIDVKFSEDNQDDWSNEARIGASASLEEIKFCASATDIVSLVKIFSSISKEIIKDPEKEKSIASSSVRSFQQFNDGIMTLSNLKESPLYGPKQESLRPDISFDFMVQKFSIKLYEDVESSDKDMGLFTKREVIEVCLIKNSFSYLHYTFPLPKRILEIQLQDFFVYDKFYSPHSVYYNLLSSCLSNCTDPMKNKELTEPSREHLIKVKLIETGGKIDHIAPPSQEILSDYTGHFNFNELNVQWNPGTMTILYQLLTSIFDRIEELDMKQEDIYINLGDFITKDIRQHERFISNTSKELDYPEKLQSCLTFHMKVLRIQFNKNEMARNLACFEMKDMSIDFQYYHPSTSSDDRTLNNSISYLIKGRIGDMEAKDLTKDKERHELYTSFFRRSLITPKNGIDGIYYKQDIMKFSYGSNQQSIDQLDIILCCIEFVYINQKILELVDYFYEGVLGTLLSRTILQATQLLLKEAQSNTTFSITINAPVIMVPSDPKYDKYFRLSSEKLILVHYPLSYSIYSMDNVEGILKKSVVFEYNDLENKNFIFSTDLKTITLYSAKISTISGDTKISRNIFADPINFTISIEDITSPCPKIKLKDDTIKLPRFHVECTVSVICIRLSRYQYLMTLDFLNKNLSADPLYRADISNIDHNTLSPLSDSSFHSCSDNISDGKVLRCSKLAAERPKIEYLYANEDVEKITLKIIFKINILQCYLLTDEINKPRSLANINMTDLDFSLKLGDPEIIDSDDRNDFKGNFYDFSTTPHPCIKIQLKNICFEDMYSDDEDVLSKNCELKKSYRAFIRCLDPVIFYYEWQASNDNETKSFAELSISHVILILVPYIFENIVQFFQLPLTEAIANEDSVPSRTDRAENVAVISARNKMETANFSSSESFRSHDVFNIKTKNVELILPENFYESRKENESGEIVITSDFHITQTTDYSINYIDMTQESRANIIVEGSGMEIVLRNVERQGCMGLYTGRTEMICSRPLKNIDANQMNSTIKDIQIIEPSNMKIDYLDIFQGKLSSNISRRITSFQCTKDEDENNDLRQNIVSVSFTPIDVYLSYSDFILLHNIYNKYLFQTSKPVLGESGVELTKQIHQNEDKVEDKQYHFNCVIQSMSLTLINDIKGCDMGLLKLQISRFNTFLNSAFHVSPNQSNDSKENMISGGGSYSFIAYYYNPDNREWDPLCDSWDMEVVAHGELIMVKNQQVTNMIPKLQIVLNAQKFLNIVVSHGLLETLASSLGTWNRLIIHKEGLHDKKKYSFTLINKTGLDVSFWVHDTVQNKRTVPNDDVAAIQYTHSNGKGKGLVRQYGNNNNFPEKKCAQNVFHEEDTEKHFLSVHIAGYKDISDIVCNELGVFSFLLIPENVGEAEVLPMVSLICETVLTDGRVQLTLSSKIKIFNSLNVPIDFLINDPTWQSPSNIVECISPRMTSAVPISLSLGSELRLRPSYDSNLQKSPSTPIYGWSSPIPLHTNANTILKATCNVVGDNETNCKASYIFCISLEVEDGTIVAEPPLEINDNSIYTRRDLLQYVKVYRPVEIINRLPISMEFQIFNSIFTAGNTPSQVTAGKIEPGCNALLSNTERSLRPSFSCCIQGCQWSKSYLLDIISRTSDGNSDKVRVFAMNVRRRSDNGKLSILVTITSSFADSILVSIYAEIWFLNRTGLPLLYGNNINANETWSGKGCETIEGNARITIFSNHIGGKSLTTTVVSAVRNVNINEATSNATTLVNPIRIRLRNSDWSKKFDPDPQRLSWHEENISLKSSTYGKNDTSEGILYEFGVSADYSTQHFGNYTTLVSLFPRYLLKNKTTNLTLKLCEIPEQRSNISSKGKYHLLESEKSYALYWLSGVRSMIHFTVIHDNDSTDPIDESINSWSDPINLDSIQENHFILSCGVRNYYINVDVSQGSISEGSIAVTFFQSFLTASNDQQLNENAQKGMLTFKNEAEKDEVTPSYRLDTQFAGVQLTISDMKKSNIIAVAGKHEGAKRRLKIRRDNENIAKFTLSKIRMEFVSTFKYIKANLLVESASLEDLMDGSTHPLVLYPIRNNDRSDNSNRKFLNAADSNFFGLRFHEEKVTPYQYINKLSLGLQDIRLQSSMTFILRVQKLFDETVAHFNSNWNTYDPINSTDCTSFLACFSPTKSDDIALTKLTGNKIYIKKLVIHPVRLRISFSRRSSDIEARNKNTLTSYTSSPFGINFWINNLKFRIEDAPLYFQAFQLNDIFATSDSIFESMYKSYYGAVKTQAFGLLESIQVTSLVSDFVTDGVSSLVSTITGSDPNKSNITKASAGTNDQFSYTKLSNNEIIRKHTLLFDGCNSQEMFYNNIRHMIFDWDTNHSGIEARHCILLAIINSSRHSILIKPILNDGADLKMIPPDRKFIASAIRYSAYGDHLNNSNSNSDTTGQWRPERASIIFAWGYTPTLFTTGDIYFQVKSNAFHVFISKKDAQITPSSGFTVAFVDQEIQTWWSRHIIMVGDDLTNTNSIEENNNDSNESNEDYEFEVEFNDKLIGIIAHQETSYPDKTKKWVIVRECSTLQNMEPGPALKCGLIKKNDIIIAVNGIKIETTIEFQRIVKTAGRPIIFRFRRENLKYDKKLNDNNDKYNKSINTKNNDKDKNDIIHMDDFSLFGK